MRPQPQSAGSRVLGRPATLFPSPPPHALTTKRRLKRERNPSSTPVHLAVFLASAEVELLAASKASPFHARPATSPIFLPHIRAESSQTTVTLNGVGLSGAPSLHFLPLRAAGVYSWREAEGARNCAFFALEQRASLPPILVRHALTLTTCTDNLPLPRVSSA